MAYLKFGSLHPLPASTTTLSTTFPQPRAAINGEKASDSRGKRRAAIVAMSIACLGFIAPSDASASGGLAPSEGAQLNWKTCIDVAAEWDADDSISECSMLTVPLDYAKPQGRSIKIAVSRIKATQPEKRRGILLTNLGGPGMPGLSDPRDLTAGNMRELGKYFDLVGFDIRGSGYSEKPGCSEFSTDEFPAPPPNLTEEEREKFNRGAYAETLKTCALKDVEFSQSMTTTSVARDMDQIRVALGENKISYLGNSWGTSLGAVYRGLFDQHVERMVWDSVMAPGRSTDDRGQEEQKAATETLYRDFTAWIADRDTSLHLGRSAADVSRKLLALREDLETKPRGEVTAEEFNSYLLSPRARWAKAGKKLSDIAAGQTSTKSIQESSIRTSGNGFGKPEKYGDIEFILRAVGGNESTGSRGTFEEELEKAQADKDKFPVGGYGGKVGMISESGWPFPGKSPELRNGKSQVQMFGHAYETNTPMPWAQEMKRAVGGSLSVINDDVHSSLRQVEKPAKDAVAFLLGGASFERTYDGNPIDDLPSGE